MVNTSDLKSTTTALKKSPQVTTVSEARNKSRLETIRARNKKNSLSGGKKPAESYKKYGVFGYGMLGLEAFIVVGIFFLKDAIDIIDKFTFLLAIVGGAIGETISLISGVLCLFVGFWLWWRFGKSKNNLSGEAATAAKKAFVKIIGWFLGAAIADSIPLINLIPWLTIYGLFLYGNELRHMMFDAKNTGGETQITETGTPTQSALKSQLEQQTAN